MAFHPKTSYGEEERPTSKFNAAEAQNFRLDNLWQKCATLSINGATLINWNYELDVIWRELSADATEPEHKKIAAINIEVDKVLRDKAKLYKILNEKEIFLRKTQNLQGKGTAYADKEEESMD